MKKRPPMTAAMRRLTRVSASLRGEKYHPGGRPKEGKYAPVPITLRRIGKPEGAK